MLCIDTVVGSYFKVNASVRFSLNIGNPGPIVVVMKPVQYLRSPKRELLAN